MVNDTTQQPSEASASAEVEVVDLEWEEWDGTSPFLHHCIAGSIAGVAEHTLLYPLDTVKTHMQAYCKVCPDKALCSGAGVTATLTTHPNNIRPLAASSSTSTTTPPRSSLGMWSTMRNLIQYGYSTPVITSSSSSHSSSSTSSSSSASSSSSSSSSSLLKKSTRQTGTLTTTTHHPSSSLLLETNIRRGGGYIRLWRGVQTMAIGCIPAHALYFSTYEHIKSLFTTNNNTTTTSSSSSPYLGPIGASLAGAASTFSHDVVMTPLDTIKQRMQLGHYESMSHAFTIICRNEGMMGLYRSFGVTLLTNVPYGMVMVSTNEFLRSVLSDCFQQQPSSQQSHSQTTTTQRLDLSTTLIAGCGAGFVAAGLTTPLDRIKTRLQTQTLGSTVLPRVAQNCPKATAAILSSSSSSPLLLPPLLLSSVTKKKQPEYSGFGDALGSIVREEGMRGLWRGLVPRVMTHAPAVAISWTSYEAAKKWLAVDFGIL